MAREGLMDDCGYDGFEECSNYEYCQKEAYEQGEVDILDKLKDFIVDNEVIRYDNFGKKYNCIDVDSLRNFILKESKND